MQSRSQQIDLFWSPMGAAPAWGEGMVARRGLPLESPLCCKWWGEGESKPRAFILEGQYAVQRPCRKPRTPGRPSMSATETEPAPGWNAAVIMRASLGRSLVATVAMENQGWRPEPPPLLRMAVLIL